MGARKARARSWCVHKTIQPGWWNPARRKSKRTNMGAKGKNIMDVQLQRQRLNDAATADLVEAERLSRAENISKSDKTRIDVLLASAAQKRQQASALKSDDEMIAQFNRLADDTGNPRISSLGTDEPAEQRNRAEQNKAFRNYLAHGIVEKRAMSV